MPCLVYADASDFFDAEEADAPCDHCAGHGTAGHISANGTSYDVSVCTCPESSVPVHVHVREIDEDGEVLHDMRVSLLDGKPIDADTSHWYDDAVMLALHNFMHTVQAYGYPDDRRYLSGHARCLEFVNKMCAEPCSIDRIPDFFMCSDRT